MAHRLVAVVMVSAAFLAATQPHAQEGQEEPIDVPGLYATVLAAVKESPRDPLDGFERPRGRKRLSSAEVGLLDFLTHEGKRKRRRKAAKT